MPAALQVRAEGGDEGLATTATFVGEGGRHLGSQNASQVLQALVITEFVSDMFWCQH